MAGGRQGRYEQRRNAVRVAAGHIGCRVWTLEPLRCDGYPMRVIDLSADGVLLTGRLVLSVGETVRCQLVPESGPYLGLWARAIRVHGGRLALEFVLNEESKRDRIHRWVIEEQARLRRG